MEPKKLIEFRNIVKNFDGQIVLKGVNLDIYEKEFVTLLGPSGCGKTTLLRILGGFLDADEGQVIFDGEEISKKPPYERELNTVFQKYALFPHLSVYENIAFGLKIKKMSKDIIDQKVMKMLRLIGLEGFENKNTTLLSGGQQQRVAIARALVNEPKVLLLDEPLAALDLKLRKEMQYELKRIQQEVGITFIFVTHDQEEALTMSDKIVVMKGGEIQQIGTPEEIYNEPANRYVANFIGESNIIPGIMLEDYKVRFDDITFDCVDLGFKEKEPVDVVIRPEDIDIVDVKDGKMTGEVLSVLFKGVHYEIVVMSGKNEIVVQSTKKAEIGSEVGIIIEPEGIHVMIAEDTINRIESGVNRHYKLEFLEGKLKCDLTKVLPNSSFNDDEVLVDAHGDEIDTSSIKIIISIKPEDISMSDDEEAGILSGHIISLIYKGDHYSYVVRTDEDVDIIIDDEDLWNMDDYVSLIIPEDKIQYSLKK